MRGAPTNSASTRFSLPQRQADGDWLDHLLGDEDETTPYFKSHSQKIEDAAETVRQLREAVGPEVDLCIEIHRRLTPPEAVALARAAEAYQAVLGGAPERIP